MKEGRALSNRKWAKYLTGGAGLALLIILGRLAANDVLDQLAAVQWAKGFFWGTIYPIFKDVFFTPTFFGVIALILLVERLFPVNKDQKTFSVGFFHDMGWLIFALITEAFVVVAYIDFLNGVYDRYMRFLVLDGIRQWPYALRFAWGVLLGDFFSWFQHWVKHKVPWFWEIHAVHHSQQEMNVFTDFRFHFMEYLISRTISVIPMLVLAVDTPHIVWFSVFTAWLTRFYHASIRMNFGPLRYVFVTPQSHRIHHSIEKRHRDKNFGVIFSFWDRIFGTAYDKADEYPDTGIEDSQFPLEMETTLISVFMIPIKQTIYPFLKIIRAKRKA